MYSFTNSGCSEHHNIMIYASNCIFLHNSTHKHSKMLYFYHLKNRNCCLTVPNTVLPHAQPSTMELLAYLNVCNHLLPYQLWILILLFGSTCFSKTFFLSFFFFFSKLKIINLPAESYVQS